MNKVEEGLSKSSSHAAINEEVDRGVNHQK